MNDETISKLLGSLERVPASERFTSEVMSRLGGPKKPAAPSTRLARWAVAATLLTATGLGVGLEVERRAEEKATLALAAERQAIEDELTRLRTNLVFDPVIEIGERDGVRYVLDVSPAVTPQPQLASIDITY